MEMQNPTGNESKEELLKIFNHVLIPQLRQIGDEEDVEEFIDHMINDLLQKGEESKYANLVTVQYIREFQKYLKNGGSIGMNENNEFKRMQELAGININESYQDKLEDLLADYGSEEEIALYISSLNNDPNQEGYNYFQDEDYIEDFKEFIANKSLDENQYGKFDELVNELRNVCKRFQVHLHPIDIKEALIHVSDIYTDSK